MNDEIDRYLRENLVHWAAKQKPPSNARARLLLQAATPSIAMGPSSEEWRVEQPQSPQYYLHIVERDLSGMFDYVWGMHTLTPTLNLRTG